MIMWWTYPVFIFYKFFRGRSFDYDFDAEDERGKVYSVKMGIVYHYWKTQRYQTLFQSYKSHVIDFWVGVIGFLPWVLGNIVYWPIFFADFVWRWSTLDFWWRTFTPWSEKNFECFALWFSQAEIRDVWDY